MYKRLKACAESAERLLEDRSGTIDWERETAELLVQISFFQHERLIHLLVTLAFALMVTACALVTILTYNLVSCLLMGLLIVLLVPYLVHYYHLENGTQALYRLYDRMVERRDGRDTAAE
jgi:hypothetical protein